jgi:hypothetical protein
VLFEGRSQKFSLQKLSSVHTGAEFIFGPLEAYHELGNVEETSRNATFGV